MAELVSMPKLGFTQDEGTLVEWHKKVGDSIKKGEPFFDVETDKSVISVEATTDGTLLKILLEPHNTVPVFTPIAVIGQPGEDPDAVVQSGGETKKEEPAQEEAAPAAPAVSAVKSGDTKLKLTPKARKLVEDEKIDPACLAEIKGTGFQGGITAKDIKASPVARRLAEKTGVDLAEVQGTGNRGKIMKSDVERAAASKPKAESTEEKIIASVTPYSGVRKVIGERLSQSKFTAPHLYFRDSVDTTKLTEFRKMINENSDVKIGVSDILIKAASKALTKYPEINASLVDNQIISYETTNIGTAVAGDRGLIVPVVKNSQRKTIGEIAKENRDLVERAKSGKLQPQEYSGGTFSISNLGMFDIEDFTAIINPPESAILAVSSVRKKAVVVTNAEGEDEIVIKPIMNLCLSVDHRIIDGLPAVQFLGYFKDLLENPIKILI